MRLVNGYPYYRLMMLTRSNLIRLKATGSLIYLRLVAQNHTSSARGRQWIELSSEPSVLRKQRR